MQETTLCAWFGQGSAPNRLKILNKFFSACFLCAKDSEIAYVWLPMIACHVLKHSISIPMRDVKRLCGLQKHENLCGSSSGDDQLSTITLVVNELPSFRLSTRKGLCLQ